MRTEVIISDFDRLPLSVAYSEPEGQPQGIVQISHGMAEHKERYYPFMEYLSSNGYICVIHDHRGHGGSVRSEKDYGFFYTEKTEGIINDLHQVSERASALYPGLPVYLFAHSMGTLVARNFMKKFDSDISKVILCGPPTRNSAAGLGLLLARFTGSRRWSKEPNHSLNKMAFSNFNKGFSKPNEWLSVNPDNVDRYNNDQLCGFTFTTNGFINLLKLQKEAFRSSDWHPRNTELPIFLIAGKDDPVIISAKKFKELADFLNGVGYTNVTCRLYGSMRHEILNESDNLTVFDDIADFLRR
ncbi:MAG: alpha/beta hydrolase [Parasporobacterium sp.]|nr:alpha/beta hydrolase [Parasporobacterium sp.]